MKTRQRKVSLLDVNVLLALIDPAHEFHSSAHDWFKRNRHHEWATCPITEKGLTVDLVHRILAELVQVEGHRFWPDSFSVLEANRFNLADAGSKHLTDIYLVGLATARAGRFVMFDRTIQWRAVTGCNSPAQPTNLSRHSLEQK